MSNMKLEQFIDDYQDRCNDVSGSNHRTFPVNISAWFETIDEYTPVREIVGKLEALNDFDEWLEKAEKTMVGMVGSGRLGWPKDQTKRLGMQIALYRHFAAYDRGVMNFAHHFMPVAGGNFDDELYEVNNQIFDIMSRDLGKLFERSLQDDNENVEVYVPASDRFVSIDHNSQQYNDTIEKIDKVIRAVRESNDFAQTDPDDREQRLAELEVTKILLKAPRVSVSNIKAVAIGALAYLVTKFADGLIGVLADAAMTAMKALIGL